VEVATGHLLSHWHAPAVCRFLAEVGRDGRRQLHGFDWGPAERFPFLPRVQAGRAVLRLARWRIEPSRGPAPVAPDPDGPDLPAGDQARFGAAFAGWRSAWRVPRLVQLGAGDNRLLLDLDDPAQVEQVRRELRRVRRGQAVSLLEALPGPGQAWLPGPGGRYAAELAVPLVRRAPSHAGPPIRVAWPGPGAWPGPAPASLGAERAEPAPGEGGAAARLRPPGSEWLYAKLYCDPEAEEALITGPVRELAGQAVRSGLADGWFFVRYADPGRHVRLRLRGDPGRVAGELLPALCAWAGGLVDAGACVRFSIDCYEREVDRYGGPAATELAERLFAADSDLVAALLGAEPPGPDRVALAVLTVDDLLGGLGLDPGARLRLVHGWVADRRQAGPAWRRRKAELRGLLAGPERLAGRPGGPDLLGRLAERRAEVGVVAAGLAALAAAGLLGAPLGALARSYAHMHCNRLLGPDGGAEQATLGLLLRARESLAAAPLGV
jgi:thiopeptide-type bacteriocin biosynthesis protein